MLSYRHAFHAGGSADVLKHAVLAFCLDYMVRKEKPLLCIDTHAGAGSYVLREGYAAQNREWEQGLGKLPASGEMPTLLRRYSELCFSGQVSGDVPAVYPGSPLIMARLLRPGDRLVCCELHPADYAACRSAFAALPEKASLPGTDLRQADGFAALTGLLPPPSRRGLIHIDPSYEVKDDYDRTVETVQAALRRFATGTYLIWYPLLREPPAAGRHFPERLLELYRGNRCRVELYTTPHEHSPRGMFGSGLIICNPPWTLAAALTESLPILGTLIGSGENGWKVDAYVL